MTETPARNLRSFGRIKGRPLKPGLARAMVEAAPALALAGEGPIAPDDLFPGRPLALEIGFGAGEHLAAQAARRPDWGVIGVEPFLNGFSACVRDVAAQGLSNVRLHQGDARDVLARLPDASLARIWILFPDPWPKARHHKRRLIQPAIVAEFARTLAPGAEVRFATDWRDYADRTLRLFLAEPCFDWPAERASDWRMPWPDHAPTRYQAKQLGDTAPIFLRFVRS
jgi:tRNA (guanine-N7-)-methyltransferase